MASKQITLGDATYTIAPLNFTQYESHFFTEDGEPRTRILIGAVVRDALANAETGTNPPFEKIQASHVVDLYAPILKLSGLVRGETSTGEAQQ